MQKRLFLGISVPENVKKRLFRLVENKFQSLPVKWARPENMHITLSFLGHIQEENIPAICDSIRESLGNIGVFELDFEKIEYGPGQDSKRMIWATGKRSEELEELKFRLESALGDLRKEKKKFTPHITLGRIRRGEWLRLEKEPDIFEEYKFNVPVSSVELLESKSEKGKRVYYTLESFPLNIKN
ncbi:MAG: RNA 2',3'-cyclic phosphodiesterase [Parcubacteria group bacterium]|jgi:2'-5' RNA ligase